MDWNFILPLVFVVFAIGQIFDVLRLLKPTLRGTIATHRIAVNDVRKMANSVCFAEQSEVLHRLDLANAALSACAQQIASGGFGERRAVREQLIVLGKEINALRRIVEPFIPEEN